MEPTNANANGAAEAAARATAELAESTEYSDTFGK